MTSNLANSRRRVGAGIVWVGTLLALLPTASVWASCSMVVPPSAVKEAGYLSGAMGARGMLRVGTESTQFAFKCDSNTNYSLMLAGSSNGVVTLPGNGGAMISLLARIHSIDGRSVNQFFQNLPATGYQASAAAGKLYQVVIDFVPLPPKGAGSQVSGGQYTGSAQFSIAY